MNWFDTSGLTSLAKTALKEAQKTIDKALDIQDESGEEQEEESTADSKDKSLPGSSSDKKDDADFFASWGLTVSAESPKADTYIDTSVVTESPLKSSQSLWGSFAGSFFEQAKTNENVSAIVRPPKAKSMNVISDSNFGSSDDLFSKSQLVMSDGEGLEIRKDKLVTDSVSKDNDRRSSSHSNKLSIISSQNSSDSVEILSQSMKTTPDSEAVSLHSISQSSSVGQKLNSESVEILPDSLVSPSSIECLGFDSSSDKNSSTSSNLSCTSPSEENDKKSTPVNDRTECADTADSVSLVADDDEDTISYNSVSECTAPTVLDTDEKTVSLFCKVVRTEPHRKVLDKDLFHLEPPLIPQRMQVSENSSNDGSWSDRTLNADNDSVTLDATIIEEQRKEIDQEDILIEKLSDSSSFYNVNVSTDVLRSESSAFINVEKQHCNATESSDSSQRDSSVKERTSPISSDSKSDLVKIGSDRTSGHTSGDELETATSSDIEIIPSPNGDNGHGFCRNSPSKYPFKLSKFEGHMSPGLVDLVLGKSLATRVRGHNRDLSEASVQSNASDDSQGSENERLMRRLCEMAEVLEARENRLMEVSRSHAELVEKNSDLKIQMESLLAKHEAGDITTITEDYTQRMSALEKKFQQAIREKDQLRKQLDNLKSESLSHKNSSEYENNLKERDEMIAQLQEEGEKLAKQQLQHSNIIKKLRAKEKDNEQVIKSLRDKITEVTAELDRLKRSMAAKEELEVNQIEAVYRLTTANKKLETELEERCSALDDTTQRLESARTSLEAARRELADLQRNGAELQRRRDAAAALQADRDAAHQECERLRGLVQHLRAEMVNEEKRWVSREESLRHELRAAQELCSAVESRAGVSGEAGPGAAALLAQLSALQRSALERERAHATTTSHLAQQLADAEMSAAKAVERERLAREEASTMQHHTAIAEGLLQDARARLEACTEQCQQCLQRLATLEGLLESKTKELESVRGEYERQVSELRGRVEETERRLGTERAALETERKRNAILQEQISSRGEISPPHSVASDSLSASLWNSEEGGRLTPPGGAGGGGAVCAAGLAEGLAEVQRREGELRAAGERAARLRGERDALRDHLAATQAKLDDLQGLQEQYDALLQMYGEKEEQLQEARLDLHDVTQLYKAQLDELIRLKQHAPNGPR